MMRVTVTQEPNAQTELIVRCADPSQPEVQELLRLVDSLGRRIPARQAEGPCYLEPSEVLYGEFVNRNVFLYTADETVPTAVTLAQLETEYDGFLRCSKSMVVNLRRIRRLKSEAGGRILATLSNGERVLISRHYASALRKALAPNQKGEVQS